MIVLRNFGTIQYFGYPTVIYAEFMVLAAFYGNLAHTNVCIIIMPYTRHILAASWGEPKAAL